MASNVRLDLIRIDGGTQCREAITEERVEEYAQAYRDGAALPPLVVYLDGADHWLADGFHRYHAGVRAGLTEVGAEIHKGTRRDAVLYAVGANHTHGLPRSNADKRKAIVTLLQDEEWAKWSDVAIGRQCHVNDKTVAKYRAELQPRNSEVVRKGRDGKERSLPAKKALAILKEAAGDNLTYQPLFPEGPGADLAGKPRPRREVTNVPQAQPDRPLPAVRQEPGPSADHVDPPAAGNPDPGQRAEGPVPQVRQAEDAGASAWEGPLTGHFARDQVVAKTNGLPAVLYFVAGASGKTLWVRDYFKPAAPPRSLPEASAYGDGWVDLANGAKVRRVTADQAIALGKLSEAERAEAVATLFAAPLPAELTAPDPEVVRLTAELNEARAMIWGLACIIGNHENAALNLLTMKWAAEAERNEARAECERLTRERDHAALRLQCDGGRLADEVAVLIRQHVIDSRSPAADALLDFREPPPSPRADRLAAQDDELERLRAECDKLRGSVGKEGGVVPPGPQPPTCNPRDAIKPAKPKATPQPTTYPIGSRVSFGGKPAIVLGEAGECNGTSTVYWLRTETKSKKASDVAVQPAEITLSPDQDRLKALTEVMSSWPPKGNAVEVIEGVEATLRELGGTVPAKPNRKTR